MSRLHHKRYNDCNMNDLKVMVDKMRFATNVFTVMMAGNYVKIRDYWYSMDNNMNLYIVPVGEDGLPEDNAEPMLYRNDMSLLEILNISDGMMPSERDEIMIQSAVALVGTKANKV